MLALRKEVDAAEALYMAANKSGSDQTEKLWVDYRVLHDTNLSRIFELARQEPSSETAFEMFDWILTARRGGGLFYSNSVQSIKFLRDYHSNNPNIAWICWNLGRNWNEDCQPALELLRIASTNNPSRLVRGHATFALARLTKQKTDNLVFYTEPAPPGNRWYAKAKEAYWKEVKNEDPTMVADKAKQLFELVLNKYADCTTQLITNHVQSENTLGEMATIELYGLNHLMVGKVTPESEGIGVDGKGLKLSDYRGKVVMLSFWASWCGPCMQKVPDEIKLTERMKGKPFALIGVNGDTSQKDAERAIEKAGITWPSFWSEQGDDGPIPTTWNVHFWPTVYVLDQAGVILFKSGDMYLVNQKIDQLLNLTTNTVAISE